jgi:GTPase SAR1 family protein
MERAHYAIFPADDHQDEVTDDILAIEITGRNKRALQLVDLPGLIKYHQYPEVVPKIESMVEGYMSMPQSIILTIVPANDDLNNAMVFNLCEKYDSIAELTLSIITKPDLSPAGKPEFWTDIVQSRNPDFQKFSWHVLRNRDRANHEEYTFN